MMALSGWNITNSSVKYALKLVDFNSLRSQTTDKVSIVKPIVYSVIWYQFENEFIITSPQFYVIITFLRSSCFFSIKLANNFSKFFPLRLAQQMKFIILCIMYSFFFKWTSICFLDRKFVLRCNADNYMNCSFSSIMFPDCLILKTRRPLVLSFGLDNLWIAVNKVPVK